MREAGVGKVRENNGIEIGTTIIELLKMLKM